ncbi:hypothetical protein LUZ61_015762 [Rhynchospora tenuis]|uniref:Glycosyltransferase N-terminal domain-containing protein n=1 Tax=Rhynchospora tenuis TaxID=198213 RepID=A0AAD6EJ79_9POAL|nr:hypothetical protein LUZ61_015762 [Rhynchospora tenuis]
MSAPPHVLVLPWPMQGHIVPLMHLSHVLADNGFKITFVNTEDNHNRIVSAGTHADRFHMISIPDGLGPEEQRFGPRLVDAIEYNLPSQLENLIRKINKEGNEKITFLIVDGAMGWAVEVAERLGLRSVVFSPHSATFLAIVLIFQSSGKLAWLTKTVRQNFLSLLSVGQNLELETFTICIINRL